MEEGVIRQWSTSMSLIFYFECNGREERIIENGLLVVQYMFSLYETVSFRHLSRGAVLPRSKSTASLKKKKSNCITVYKLHP